ncbi:nickel-dependent lactate racemase [Rubripirellula sp.]|jgi:lactate racemase|nr:nickel-dependent lactate racemase [Rubripirellula sp.]MDB4749540.1 nickel-dependent lactate racemase [Rubripirellula sp.]
MALNIRLNYGREGLQVEIPHGVSAEVIRKPAMPVLARPVEAIKDAFAAPVGLRDEQPRVGLGEVENDFSWACDRKSACIAICDITRPVPNGLFLRPLIDILLANGMPKEAITVLVATGLHRPNVGEELEELVGDKWVLENVRVKNHDARDDPDHVFVGKTSTRGTVVKLDRSLVEADLKIATGLVEPHFMAGYSGGRKVIAPGVAHAETITTFHSARFMADPAAVACNLKNNPLHEEQLEIVKLIGGAMGLNTVLDEHRQLSFVNFGEIITSHEQAIDFVRQYCEVKVTKKYRTVVTTASGYPLDKTYYQTVKGMVGAMNILEPGGDLIIASECGEGFGSEEFSESQRRLVDLGPETFLRQLFEKSHADIDEWQSQMQLKPMAVGQIHLYCPQLSEMQWAITGVNQIASVEQAILESVQRQGESEIAVIPEGPYVEPSVGRSAGASD